MRPTARVATPPRLSRTSESQIQIDEPVSKKHPDQPTEGKVRAERNFRGIRSSTDGHRDHADERANNRTGKNTEQDRAPSKKCADSSEKLQVAASHCFARNLQLAQNAGHPVHFFQRKLFRTDGKAIVMQPEGYFA